MRPSRVSVACLAGVAWAGLAFAQPPPATTTAQGPGRGGFVPAPVVIGPSAPVPPEVAIPRPTPEEIARVNALVKKFIDAESSSNKTLLKKFEPLLTLQPPRKNVAATFTRTAQRQGPRHDGFVEIARQGNIDLLLHGDSITDWWVQGDANKAMFEKYFAGIRTANFAIAGDTTQGVLWGLANGEGQGFQPKAVMLMIGTNNGSNTGPEIAEGVGAVVYELRKDFPNAKILLLAIFPRSVPGDPVRDKIAEANRIIARLDDQKHVFFMDIGAKFLDDKGVFLPDTFRPDNLHPLAKGYDIWGAAVKDKLAELMKPDPAAGLVRQPEQVMSGRDVSDTGRVSPDGRFIVIQRTRNLAIRELSTGRVRELPTGQRATSEAFAQGATFSPDGGRLAYEWYDSRAGHGAVFVVGTDESNTSPARLLYDDRDVVSVTPMDWSADSKLLAVRVRHSNRTAQIGTVTVADGTYDRLASVPWSGAGGVRFSPDSRRLAFHRPTRPGASSHDVVIVSREGAERHAALATPDDELMIEWAPDGKRLLIASDRSGTIGLWSVVVDGVSRPTPKLIRPNIGTFASRGLTQTGVLYYVTVQGGTDIFIGPYDSAARRLLTPPKLVIPTWKGAASQPDLSPDGEELAVLSRRDAELRIDDSSAAIVIKSVQSGRIREVQPTLSWFRAVRWSPNGRTFIGYGEDLNGRPGIVKIDAHTGSASLAAPQETCAGFPFWAPDGRSFYCFHFERKEIVQVDLASGALLRSFPSNAQAVGVSPDGRYLLAGAEQGFNLIPVTADAGRRFVGILPPSTGMRSMPSPADGPLNLTSSTAWHPDGKGVVFFGSFGGQQGVWYVSVEGGPVQRLAPDVERVGVWRFNPKSGQVVFGSGPVPRFDLWSLGDFL